MRRRCLRRSLLPRLAFVAQAALPGACSLRSLDDLEARGTDPGASLEAALSPDAGACVHDSECAAGRCREEVGRCEPCPDDMHLARFVNGESFCIEAHEVSRADYDVFLQALERGDLVCIPGSANRLLAAVQRAAPHALTRRLAREVFSRTLGD